MSARGSKGLQRGGFLMGMIVGLLVGLGLALGVALYVTKAPNPFVTKVPPRSPVQDAAEAERNRNWDPNAPLAGKNPARAGSGTLSGGPPTAPAVGANPAPPFVTSTPAPHASAAAPTATAREASAVERTAPPVAAVRPPPTTLSTVPGSDPFTYFVQAGAYAKPEDAEQQRARLAMLGVTARLTEREQAGRTVYRVRIGPFERKEEADATKERLGSAGVDAALVRVQK